VSLPRERGEFHHDTTPQDLVHWKTWTHKQQLSKPNCSPTSREHIEVIPGLCGGKPRIAGTRIRVQDVYVWHELQGQSADEIVYNFPHLTLADVHAALSYYFDHRDEIQQQMKADDSFINAMRQKNPSKLLEKLKARNATDASIPS
jgi:uncharacterized protein (DUF433 family)